jgi:arsenate reductase
MPDSHVDPAPSTFFEINASLPLIRRAFVELIGTCFLTIAMVGAGLAVRNNIGTESIAASLVISVCIAGSLVGLIVSLGKISGGHYNPLITLGQWLRGERSIECTIAYVAGQFIGSVFGAQVSNVMFGETLRMREALPSGGMITSEIVAATGLMIVVFGCARSSKWETGPFAVGAWLTAAILATPSASYANPAVTIAATVAAGPVGLSGPTAVVYVAAQIVGLLIALGITKVAFGSDQILPAVASKTTTARRKQNDSPR